VTLPTKHDRERASGHPGAYDDDLWFHRRIAVIVSDPLRQTIAIARLGQCSFVTHFALVRRAAENRPAPQQGLPVFHLCE
jgi:hypothetical protein